MAAAIAGGDVGALASLYDRYAGEMLALALRILGDTEDAEEIVVDAFAKVWRSAERYDAGRGSVVAWLTTIVRSRALDRLRSRRARLMGEPADAGYARSATGPGEDPERAVSRSEYRAHVQGALGALSEDQRRAIELALYEGMTHSEIASALGEPLGTIKTRMRSGMQKLKTALEPLYRDEFV